MSCIYGFIIGNGFCLEFLYIFFVTIPYRVKFSLEPFSPYFNFISLLLQEKRLPACAAGINSDHFGV